MMMMTMMTMMMIMMIMMMMMLLNTVIKYTSDYNVVIINDHKNLSDAIYG